MQHEEEAGESDMEAGALTEARGGGSTRRPRGWWGKGASATVAILAWIAICSAGVLGGLPSQHPVTPMGLATAASSTPRLPKRGSTPRRAGGSEEEGARGGGSVPSIGKKSLRLRGGQVAIRKPEIDPREYRHIKLPNRLECVLVSDRETKSGAAALCISVGQLDDPPGVDGLAHFLEHMLFLGTERYPDESNFDQFCSSCAGYSNAWTSLDHTVYHFIVTHDHLKDTLDRFSAFFSCPLLSEGGTEREMHAVDSEHNKNLQDDDRREFQVLRNTCEASHPMRRFGSGNYASLHDAPLTKGKDVRSELLNMHEKLYSANLMKLCIVGSDSLDELESWVRDMFGAVPDLDVPKKRSWAEHRAFGGAGWHTMQVIVPVKERRKLSIMFPSPSIEAEYRTKPQHLLSHILGHEGPGSLLAVLKDLGWATELVAGPGTSLPEESIFTIGVSLTEEGLPHWESVVQIVFHCLHLVRNSGMKARSRVWKEIHDVQELNFRYRSKEREDSYSESIAYGLNLFPPEDVLCASDLFFEPFTEEVNDRMDEILDSSVQASNVRVVLSCPEDEMPTQITGGGGGEGDGGRGEWKTDEWFGTKFWEGDFMPGLVEEAGDSKAHTSGKCRCSAHAAVQAMDLPPENVYVPSPSKCTLLPGGNQALQDTPPNLVVDLPSLKGWHLHDTSLGQPKATMFVQLSSAIVDASVEGASMLRMLLEVLELSFNEQRYMAEEAGLTLDITNYSFSTPCSGLRLMLHGYSSTLPMLLSKIMSAIVELKVKSEEFEMAKEKVVMDYRNRRFQQPYQHALLTCHKLLENPFFTHDQRCSVIEKCGIEDLETFKSDFLASLTVESLIVGNVAEQEAKALMSNIPKTLGVPKSGAPPLPNLGILRLHDRDVFKHEMKCPDPDHVDSAVVLYYQVGIQSHAVDTELELLCQMLDKAAYTQLRTKEQLGYIVCAEVHARWGITGIRIAVQSVREPNEVADRVRRMLVMFRKQLIDMDDDEFAGHVSSLIMKKLDPDRTVEGKCARIFYEIATRRFVFDRREQQVQHLKSVTKRHLLQLFDDYLATGGRRRKEVCAMVVGKDALSAREADDYRTSDGSCVYILNGHAGRGVTFEDIALVPEAFYYEQP